MFKKTVMAMFACAAMVVIAGAPMAQSIEIGTVHEIVKDESGPPSICAETWEITPLADWTWHGHIVNYGMRWLTIDVVDMDTGDLLIDREMYRFASSPDGWVDTQKVAMIAGHLYSITATPNGPLGSRCTVEDVLEGSPVASFIASVDGATVSVDASASYDPDGTIVSYDWDWGDGSAGTGETASHTYTLVPLEILSLEPSHTRPVIEPAYIFGITYDEDGNVLLGCTVKITHIPTGLYGFATTYDDGYYMFDLVSIVPVYSLDDLILVEAWNGELYGSAIGLAPPILLFTQIDVTLKEAPSGPLVVTITLTVTDDDGMMSTVSQEVILYT
jgi:hypothetical protein